MQDNKDRPATLTVSTTLASDGSESLVQTTQQSTNSVNKDISTEPVVMCQISDTGHGILPEHLDKVFDPFFTTKEVGQGTGLGLSISYSIVKTHGGDIMVESTPGQGTTFILTLSGVRSPDEE